MKFNPPPGWPLPHGWEPPPGWEPDPGWPPAPPGWKFWDGPGEPAGPAATQTPSRRRPPTRPIVVVAVTIAVIAGLVGGGYALVKRWRTGDADGTAVAGQLRGTYPNRPSVGWRLPAHTIFDRAEFVRPEPTSYQYRRAGFIDLGDTLVTSAVLSQSDRSATLVAVDAATGDVRWTAHAGFAPVCATATIDGLLPCLGRESVFTAPDAPRLPPYVHFLRMSDGGVEHQLPVSEHTRAVETDGTAVYTMGYELSSNTRVITRGTVDDLTADWQQRYRLNDDGEGCVGSGDAVYHGVEGDVVYSGIDAGMVVADVADGRRLLPMDVINLSVYPTQGFTAEICDGTDPDIRSTIVVDTGGATLRTVDGSAAHPWLVAPDDELPYIIGRSAYDFASGRQLWTAGGGGDAELHTVIGDTVLGGGRGNGPLVAFDLATGEHLWTSSINPTELDVSDGQRVMVGTESGLAAVNLATGRQDWVLPGVEGWRSVAPAGDGFAHATNEFIAYYPPTGGPSVAPGRHGHDTTSVDDSGGLITKCGRTPEMTPVDYRAENGSLIVTMKVTARCPGGDIISTDRLRVTISDDLGRICSAVFDFSRDPLVIGGDGTEPTTLELVFGSGTFSRHPNTLGDRAGRASASDEIVTESTASGTEVVDCEDEGRSGGAQSAERRTDQMSVKSAETPADDPAPACGSDADALEALRAQVDADRPFVQSRLSDRWVAQLSSKRPGLVAPDVDGRVLTWTPCEILQQHLRMRGQYPEVRLVWSDEWRTFDLAGWWVTIAGVTFPGPDEANGWCDARAIPVDECYAKVVSNTRDSRGSTKYRR